MGRGDEDTDTQGDGHAGTQGGDGVRTPRMEASACPTAGSRLQDGDGERVSLQVPGLGFLLRSPS